MKVRRTALLPPSTLKFPRPAKQAALTLGRPPYQIFAFLLGSVSGLVLIQGFIVCSIANVKNG